MYSGNLITLSLVQVNTINRDHVYRKSLSNSVKCRCRKLYREDLNMYIQYSEPHTPWLEEISKFEDPQIKVHDIDLRHCGTYKAAESLHYKTYIVLKLGRCGNKYKQGIRETCGNDI